MKTCRRCGVAKALTEFHRRGEGWQAKCKQCAKELLAEWRRANPEKDRAISKKWRQSEKGRAYHRAYQRGSHFMKRYGITVEQYDAMVAEQRGRCGACKREEPLVVDHCHDTGAVRGLLCDSCNRGIGNFRDDPAALTGAAAYLRKAMAR